MELKNIPGTQGFKASKSGLIFDPNGELRTQYKNGDGYLTASVLTETGKWVTYGVHRLVALAHIPYIGNLDELTVNHLDGNIENNHDWNLEWVTVAENNIHAALLKGSFYRPTILMQDVDGSHQFIANLKEAGELFKCDQNVIWDAIRTNKPFQGCLLSHFGSKSVIPRSLRKKQNKGYTFRPIKILDTETNEIQYYATLGEAAEYFQTSASHIYQCLSYLDRKRLFKKRYLIVDRDGDFPVLTKEEFDLLSSTTGRDVLAYHYPSKTLFIYKSAAEFIRQNNLSKKAVTVDLKNGRLRILGGNWIYTYLNEENQKQLFDYIAVVQN